MCVCFFVCLFICLHLSFSDSRWVYIFVSLLIVGLCLFASVSLGLFMFVSLYVWLSLYVAVSPSLFLSVSVALCLSMFCFVCLCVCVHVSVCVCHCLFLSLLIWESGCACLFFCTSKCQCLCLSFSVGFNLSSPVSVRLCQSPSSLLVSDKSMFVFANLYSCTFVYMSVCLLACLAVGLFVWLSVRPSQLVSARRATSSPPIFVNVCLFLSVWAVLGCLSSATLREK